jgi:hypothetical protein
MNLDKILEKVYNTLGNKYLTDNFDVEPFEFKVKIRRGDRMDDMQDYIIEVYSVPDMPQSFFYKSGRIDNKDGIDISVLRRKFRELTNYVDSSFGGFTRTLGISFMNVE